MTEIAEQTRRGGVEPEQSTTEQAKEKVQETAQQVQQKAHEVKGQAGDRLRQQLNERSTQAGSQLQFTADAMRRTGQQLQEEGKEGPAKVTQMVAERAERLGNYMTQANTDQMLRDVENFARRQPWLMAIGGSVLGFLSSRFLKASSSTRYESGDSSQTGWQPGRLPAGIGAGYGPSGYGTPGYTGVDVPTAGGYADASAIVPPSVLDDVVEPVPAGTSRSGRSGSRGKSGK